MKTTARLLRRLDRPETLYQAQEFDRRRSGYEAAGLCYRCAAQAAYGHQLGFARVHSPCDGCVGIVAGFPLAARNGWRKLSRGRLSPPSARSSAMLTQGVDAEDRLSTALMVDRADDAGDDVASQPCSDHAADQMAEVAA
jgi:hypothetical protein